MKTMMVAGGAGNNPKTMPIAEEDPLLVVEWRPTAGRI
jgi:hypothetical protein